MPQRPQWQRPRSAGGQRPGRGRRRDRQGDHRRLSLLGRQRLLDPHREHDRAGAFPAVGRRPRPGERPPVRRPVQPAPLLRPLSPLQRHSAPTDFIGPKRSPLGLAADPGGFPLYKNGVVVGGIGVMADGVYGFDPEIQDVDATPRRRSRSPPRPASPRPTTSAPSGSASTAPPCATATPPPADFRSNPAAAPAFATLGGVGALTTVRGYYDALNGVLAGRAYGTEASGIRAATARRVRQSRRLRAQRRRGREPLPDPRRHRRRGADRGRGPRPARGGVQGDERGARPDPPPARQPRPGHHLGGRHQRRRPRPRPLARRADLRHRRLAAEGAHRRLLLGRLRRRRAGRPIPTPTSPTIVAAARAFFADPGGADRPLRLLRPRQSATSRGPISPTASWAGRRAPSRGRSPSSIPSRPASSRR